MMVHWNEIELETGSPHEQLYWSFYPAPSCDFDIIRSKDVVLLYSGVQASEQDSGYCGASNRTYSM